MHVFCLKVLLASLVGLAPSFSAQAIEAYEAGSSYTNTSGDYNLIRASNYMTPHYVEEFRNGVKINTFPTLLYDLIEIRDRSEASYEYKWYSEFTICGPFGGGCSTTKTLEGTTWVTVDLPPPPNSPAQPAFKGISHPGQLSDMDGSFTVEWDPVSGNPTHYILQERINGSWQDPIQIDALSKGYTKLDGSYGYHVKACNAYGCSGYSSTVTLSVIKTPSIPGAVSVPANSNASTFSLSWNASSGIVDHYEIDRYSGSSWQANHKTVTSTETTDTVPASGTYGYRVRSCNSLSCSGTSSAEYIDVAVTPGVPGSISAQIKPSGNVDITWTVASGSVTHYEVTRRESLLEGTWHRMVLGSVATPPWYFEETIAGHGEYYYEVRACNQVAEFVACSNVRSTPLVEVSPLTIGLTVPANAGANFSISWQQLDQAYPFIYESARIVESGPLGVITYPLDLASTSLAITNRIDGEYSYRLEARNCSSCQYQLSEAASVSVDTPLVDEELLNVEPTDNIEILTFDTGVDYAGHFYASLPVEAPAGINGIQPNLTLAYKTQRGVDYETPFKNSPFGVLGYGWTLLGIEYIHNDGSNYYLNGTHRLVPLDPTQPLGLVAGNVYRPERLPNVKVSVEADAQGELWFKLKKGEQTLDIGSGSATRRMGYGGVTHWFLDEVTDVFGNKMTVDYATAGTPSDPNYSIYPLAFHYGGYDLELIYGYRQDANTNGNSGIVLKGIRSFLAQNVRAGEYRIGQGNVSGTTRVEAVQYCGYDETGTSSSCTQPTEINWNSLPQPEMLVTQLVEGHGAETNVLHVHESESAFWSQHVFNEQPFTSQGTTYVDDGLDETNTSIDGTWVVGSISRSNGNGGFNTTEYAYNNIAARTTAMRREFPDGTYLYTGSFRHHMLLRGTMGKETNRERWTGVYGNAGSRLLSKSYTEWAGMYPDTGVTTVVRAPYACSTTEFHVDDQGNLGHAVQAIVTPTYDSNGLLTELQTATYTGAIADTPPLRYFEYDETYGYSTVNEPACATSWTAPTQAAQATLADSNISQRVKTVQYENDAANWIMGFPKTETETTRAVPFTEPAIVITTKRTQTTVPKSLHVRTLTEKFGTDAQLITTVDYNANGNPTRIEQADTLGNTRVHMLSDYVDYRYPGTYVNALGHITDLEYDLRFGAVSKTTDPNARTTSYKRNGLGRIVQTSLPDGATVTRTAVIPNTGSAAYQVSTTSQISPTKTEHYDVLGRVVATERQGFSNETIREEIYYDNLGRVQNKSVPSSDPSNTKFSSYDYDVRGRTKIITHAEGGTTTLNYSDGTFGTSVEIVKEVVRDANSKVQRRLEMRNMFGQLFESTDAYQTSMPVVTEYRYDHFGNRRWVQINGDPSTTSTSEFNVQLNERTVFDPSAGITTFQLDAFGQIAEQTDANARITEFVHDALGRLNSRVEQAGTTDQLTYSFTYDPLNGTGKMASQSGPGFSETYEYNADAQLKTINTDVTVNGLNEHFVSTWAYDNYGRPESRTFPSGLETQSTYGSHGYFSQLSYLDDTATAVPLRAIGAMNALGQATTVTLGNSLVTTRAYDAATGRIKEIKTANGGVQNNAYEWWSNGTLYSRSKNTIGTSETFSYDALNRLTSANAYDGIGPVRDLSYVYDKLGNLTNKSSSVIGDTDATNYVYNTGSPDQLDSVAEEGESHRFDYDNVGNITVDDVGGVLGVADDPRDRAISYNAWNKPTEIRKGSQTSPEAQENIHYGPDGARFYKETAPSGNETIYLYGGQFEVQLPGSGSVTRIERTYLGDVIHQNVVDTSLGESEYFRYIHRDHLGSMELITDENGQPVQMAQDFDPYGDYRAEDWTADALPPSSAERLEFTARGFTGHEHLDGVGLIHMNGRVFDPELGRFMSADPIVQAPTYSQSYNRYAYTFNSPLSFTDPSGYCAQIEDCHDNEDGLDSLLDRKQQGYWDAHAAWCWSCWSRRKPKIRWDVPDFQSELRFSAPGSGGGLSGVGTNGENPSSLYDQIGNDIGGFYDWISETNPVEVAAWQQYASGVYLDDSLSFDQAVKNFRPFARGFAEDRYDFLAYDLMKSVSTGYGKDIMSQGMWGLGRVPYIGPLFQAGSAGMLIENNMGTIMATQALTSESRELMTLTTSGPQVFRIR